MTILKLLHFLQQKRPRQPMAKAAVARKMDGDNHSGVPDFPPSLGKRVLDIRQFRQQRMLRSCSMDWMRQ